MRKNVSVSVPRVTQSDVDAVRDALSDFAVVQNIGFDKVVSLRVVDSEDAAHNVGHGIVLAEESATVLAGLVSIELVDGVYHMVFSLVDFCSDPSEPYGWQ